MSAILNNIPPVLPNHLADMEAENARNEIISRLASAQNSPDDVAETNEDLTTDEDLAPGGESEEARAERRGKLKKIVGFVVGAGLFVGLMFLVLSYLFGFGFFAPAKKVTVNRNAGNNALTNNPALADDEKLKTALTLAANSTDGIAKNPPALNPADDGSTPLTSNQSQDPNQLVLEANPDSLAKNNSVPPAGNLVILPDEATRPNNLPSGSTVSSARSASIQPPANTNPPEITGNNQVRSTGDGAEPIRNGAESSATVGRSIFFGQLPEQSREAQKRNANRAIGNNNAKNEIVVQPPTFGTLLPVRLLGAVYTLRSSGGLVRMELTREVSGRGFRFPAGTTVVGTLRGSEYNRAFITALGLIDQQSGGLVKFEGEMMGADGASGIKGERKNVKSFGSRFLAALREASGQAVNVLASRGSRGGAVIIDTASLTGGEISDELSALLHGNSRGQSNSFVKINAGAEGYVLVTDLPGEVRLSNDLSHPSSLDSINALGNAERVLPGIGLSASELADLFATNDASRIRAALPRMTPQMRELAERALRETER